MKENQGTEELLRLIKLNPLTICKIATGIAVVMGLFDTLVLPFFRVSVGDWFVLPLWIPFALYGGLQYFIWAQTERGLDLTDAELQRWGPQLEEVTPTIVEALKEERSVRDIATDLEEAHGIPSHITLRYVVHLGRALGANV